MPTSDVDLYECHCAVQQYLRTIHDMVLFNNAALLHGKCDRTRRQTPRVLWSAVEYCIVYSTVFEYCRVL